MNKQTAHEELQSLKKREKELRKIIEAPDSPKGTIKSFEDACQVLGIKQPKLPSFELTKDEKSIQAYTKLIIIARALNEGWEPNWNDSNENKYYPWFKAGGSVGFGFGATAYDWTLTTAHFGARLCFKTRELAEYTGKTFESIYKDYLMID